MAIKFKAIKGAYGILEDPARGYWYAHSEQMRIGSAITLIILLCFALSSRTRTSGAVEIRPSSGSAAAFTTASVAAHHRADADNLTASSWSTSLETPLLLLLGALLFSVSTIVRLRLARKRALTTGDRGPDLAHREPL